MDAKKYMPIGHYSEASQRYEEQRRKELRPAHERGDWCLYAWDARYGGEWKLQEEFIGISLELALTTMLRWRDQGQHVRMETISIPF